MAMITCACGHFYSSARHNNTCPKCGTTNKIDPKTKATRKPCPHCSEMIMPTAKICPFCKQAVLSFDPASNAAQTIIFSVIAFVFLSFGITYCAMWEHENIIMPWAEKETDRLMKEAERDVDRLMRKYQNNY